MSASHKQILAALGNGFSQSLEQLWWALSVHLLWRALKYRVFLRVPQHLKDWEDLTWGKDDAIYDTWDVDCSCSLWGVGQDSSSFRGSVLKCVSCGLEPLPKKLLITFGNGYKKPLEGITDPSHNFFKNLTSEFAILRNSLLILMVSSVFLWPEHRQVQMNTFYNMTMET